MTQWCLDFFAPGAAAWPESADSIESQCFVGGASQFATMVRLTPIYWGNEVNKAKIVLEIGGYPKIEGLFHGKSY